MDNGFQIAMSPVQLAAVLSDKSVTESETMSNRLLGGLDLLMGSLELAGATALCMAPEPTGLTKAACIVVGTASIPLPTECLPVRIYAQPPTRLQLRLLNSLVLTIRRHGILV